MFVSANDIIKLLMSEKNYKILEKSNTFVFQVRQSMTKDDIYAAIKSIFGTEPELVRTLNTKPRARFFRGKAGTIGGIKKAFVKMPNGFKFAS